MTTLVVKNTVLISLYECNQDLFVSLLCENKSKPTLKCEGKCQLSKIANEQQQDHAKQVLNQLQGEFFFYFQKTELAQNNIIYKDPKSNLTNYPQDIYQYLFSKANYRPPGILS